MSEYTTFTARSLHDFVTAQHGEVTSVHSVGAGYREVELPPCTTLVGIHRFAVAGTDPFILLTVQVGTDPVYDHPPFTIQFRLGDSFRVAVFAVHPAYSARRI